MRDARHKRINVTITTPEFDALQRLCALTGLGFAEVLRRAIDRYLVSPDVISSSLVSSSCLSDAGSMACGGVIDAPH